MHWSTRDLQQLNDRNISPEEIKRQLGLFSSPPSPPEVIAPCTLDRGIIPSHDLDRKYLQELFQREASKERFARFVPASGAATRMFKDLFDSESSLQEWRQTGDCSNSFHRIFFSNIKRFPFYRFLDQLVSQQGYAPESLLEKRELRPFINALLSADGLNYAKTPKGLIPFHAYAKETRTPVEEHLWETAILLSPCCAGSKVHFTVSPDWLESFVELAAATAKKIADEKNFNIEVQFSCQDPASDTIAVDLDNKPFRDNEGNLVFRPAGHGALLGNLAGTNYDLVLIKNIDNVVPQKRQPEVNAWWEIVGGLLVKTEEAVHRHWQAVMNDEQDSLKGAASFLQNTFGYQPPTNTPQIKAWVLEKLERPLRVCGMVRNLGEPGGGPFWVRTRDGVTRQIVELAQLDLSNPKVSQVLQEATHFNPVFMACALRNPEGNPLPLEKYIDAEAIILTEKTMLGRPLKALERPGLWNGAMAYWNTLFVEVPEDIFQPVKTVNDLLRPAHTNEEA